MPDSGELFKQLERVVADTEEKKELIVPTFDKIAKFVMPSRYISGDANQYEQTQVLESTGTRSARMLANWIHGFLISPYSKWFKLDLPTYKKFMHENDLTRSPAKVVWWLQYVTQMMMDRFNSADSNWLSAMQEYFLDMVTFGIACLYNGEDKVTGLPFFTCYPMTQISFNTTDEGKIDTVVRKTKMQARRIVELWKDSAGAQITATSQRSPTEVSDVHHIVLPRTGYLDDSFFSSTARFASFYVVLSKKIILEESGFFEMPYIISKYDSFSDGMYGDSPTRSCINEIVTVNKMMKSYLQHTQRSANPPHLVSKEGIDGRVDMRPGASTAYDPTIPNEPIKPIKMGELVDIVNAMMMVKQNIIETFNISWLRLTESRPQMTEGESMIRSDENLRLIAPAVSRQFTTLLSPVINRSFNIFLRGGFFDPIPKELDGEEIIPEFVSSIARIQKQTKIAGFDQMLQRLQSISQFMPDIVKRLNQTEIVDFLVDTFDLDINLVLSKEEVEKQAQDEQDSLAMQEGAELNKTNSEAFEKTALALKAMKENGATGEQIES